MCFGPRVQVTYAHRLEQVLGVGVHVQLAGLGLGDIQSGDLGDVLVLALTLLLLELEGDTADGATLDTLHQVGGVTSDLWRADKSGFEFKFLVYSWNRDFVPCCAGAWRR